jgi:hypothetical protein
MGAWGFRGRIPIIPQVAASNKVYAVLGSSWREYELLSRN